MFETGRFAGRDINAFVENRLRSYLGEFARLDNPADGSQFGQNIELAQAEGQARYNPFSDRSPPAEAVGTDNTAYGGGNGICGEGRGADDNGTGKATHA